ncbi:MAG: T9SS type A sorting domain-containing protein, partial [Bacteroidota bacterium]
QALDVVYTLTTAQPIDIVALGGTNQVSLQFQQYGARFNDLQEFQISTNGTTWITVGSNADMPVLSSAGGSAYSNPNNKTINLASYLPANPSPIWIRFSWTTAFPGSATNPNVWITYGWYIDDVKIVTNPTNDLSVTASAWGTAGLNYFQIPTTQVAPIEFSASVFNGGQNTQYNAKLNVNVNSGVFTGSSTPANIPSLDSLDLVTSTSYTPPSSTASYTVVRTITSDSTDDVPANNVLPNLNFSVTNFIYARDNNTVSGNTSNGADGFEVGNLFDIFADQTLKAINVRLAGGTSGTTVGTEIYARLYSIDPATGNFVYEEESAPLIVASNNLNTNLVMQLQTPVNMLANTTYLAVVGSFTGGLKVANAGTSEPQTSFFLDGNDIVNSTLYYQTSTPYVRLNFDPSVGLDEESSEINGISLYPNPANNETNIEFNLQSKSDVTITVADLSGKTVSTTELTNVLNGANSAKIDCASLNSGIYYVTINTNNSSVTKKFVKK